MSKEMGERMLDRMRVLGITQRELAERIGITEVSLSRYITGDREPKADTLANIATALFTTSDHLLGIENDGFDFPRVRRMLARNSSSLTQQERKALIVALFGEE